MGRNNKPTKSERLAERKERIRRNQEEPKCYKKKTTAELSCSCSKEAGISKQIAEVRKQISITEKDVENYVDVNTVGGDAEFIQDRNGDTYFVGANSTELNRVFRNKQRKLHRLRTRIDELLDMSDPDRHERARKERERNNRRSQNFLFAIGLGPRPCEKEYPKDKIIVERKGVGLILGDDGNGNPVFMRCYHRKGNECLVCDCIHDVEGNKFTLSDKAQALLENGMLEVDDEDLELQRMDLKVMGDDTLNRWAGLGPSLYDHMNADPDLCNGKDDDDDDSDNDEGYFQKI